MIEKAARPSPCDEALLVAEAMRDRCQFARLYDLYVTSIYRYLYSRVGSPADAQDLTSQVFMKALEALPGYNHQGHFAAWLYTIARHTAADFFRSLHPEIPLEDAGQAAAGLDLLSQAIRTEEVRRLGRLISSLKDEEQELIRLRYVAGLGFHEIAVLLKRNEQAVKKSVYRLLARLQRQMEG